MNKIPDFDPNMFGLSHSNPVGQYLEVIKTEKGEELTSSIKTDREKQSLSKIIEFLSAHPEYLKVQDENSKKLTKCLKEYKETHKKAPKEIHSKINKIVKRLTGDEERKTLLKYPKELENITPKIFGFIQGDSFVSGIDSLEGFNISKVCRFLIPYFENNDQSSFSDLTIEYLKELSDLNEKKISLYNQPNEVEKLAEKMLEKVSTLKEGERCLLSGGWNGIKDEGHALIYVVEKEGKDEYRFSVLNTGGGIRYHQSGIVGRKRKYSPIFQLKNVNKDVLLSKEFYLALSELFVVHNEKGDKTFLHSSGDVYERIVPSLGGEVIEVKDEDFITAQRSGSCSWKVVMNFLMREADNLQEYKKMNLELRKNSLVAFVSKIQSGDIPASEQNVELLTRSNKIFYSAVKKNQMRRILSTKEAKEYEALSKEVSVFLNRLHEIRVLKNVRNLYRSTSEGKSVFQSFHSNVEFSKEEKKIYFPDLNMTLKEVQRDSKVHLFGDEEMVLEEKQKPPSSLPFFKNTLLFLKKGKPVYIVPKAPVLLDDAKKGALSHLEELDTSSISTKILEFPSVKGELVGKNDEENLYLAYLHLANKNYEESLSFLQKLTFDPLWGMEEKQVSDWMSTFFRLSSDKSKEANVVRFNFFYTLYKNKASSLIGSDEKKTLIQLKYSLMVCYSHNQNCLAMRISEEEEHNLLQALKMNNLLRGKMLIHRFNELEGTTEKPVLEEKKIATLEDIVIERFLQVYMSGYLLSKDTTLPFHEGDKTFSDNREAYLIKAFSSNETDRKDVLRNLRLLKITDRPFLAAREVLIAIAEEKDRGKIGAFITACENLAGWTLENEKDIGMFLLFQSGNPKKLLEYLKILLK